MSAGFLTLPVIDDRLDLTFPALVCYPTTMPATGVALEGVTVHATADALVAAGRHGVVVLSHGGGGAPLLYHWLATPLAARGWIVVCPEHPGDHRHDRSLVNTDTAAARRARHASLAMDAVLGHERLGAHADASRMAAIGHSMGGVTALALAGGQPWSRARVPLDRTPDPRVRAIALLAPATDWFLAPGALDAVRVPVLAYVGEHDPITPPARVRAVLAALPVGTPCDIREVTGGGHFAFLAPFPEAMRRPDFAPAQDPPGFDRAVLQAELPGAMAEWLAAALR